MPITSLSPALANAGPRPTAVVAPDAVVCPGCTLRLHGRAYRRALRVCAWCGFHGRVPARERIVQLADPETATVIARQAEESEAMITARAAICGHPAVLACMDFAFLGGSLGVDTGERFAGACEVAVEERRSLVVVCMSGGARMQQGVAALAQMARCTVGVGLVAGARLPYVSILADPCFGGVTASFAAQADVVIAEPRARIGFAGQRVIEQAAHERLPDHFQTAEFLADHGMVDRVTARSQLRTVLAGLLAAFGGANAA